MSRKTAMAELEALLTRADERGIDVLTVNVGPHWSQLAVADVRAILNKARFADRVNEAKSMRNLRGEAK